MKKYVIYDFEVRDSRIRDVALEKGDWFTYRNEERRNLFRLYKVIDDRQLPTNGFSNSILCEEYLGSYDIDKEEYTIKKEGRKTIELDKYLKQNAVKFNSSKEALAWIKRQIERFNDIKNRATIDSKLKDVRLENDIYDSYEDLGWITDYDQLEEDDFKEEIGYKFWKDELEHISKISDPDMKAKEANWALEYIDDFKNQYIKSEVMNDLKKIIKNKKPTKDTYIVKAKSYKDALNKVRKIRSL